jgi:ABC-type molybdate transport system permease subunit
MNELVFFINKGILAGAIIGSIYALGAIGVTLIFGILRFALARALQAAPVANLPDCARILQHDGA